MPDPTNLEFVKLALKKGQNDQLIIDQLLIDQFTLRNAPKMTNLGPI